MADATDGARRSILDRPLARVLALLVFGLSVAALVYIHRDDLWPQPATEPETTAADPLARCIAERRAQVDDMVAEGVIGPERAELFKSRAEGLCRAQVEGGGPGLGPPPGAAPPPGAVRPPGN